MVKNWSKYWSKKWSNFGQKNNPKWSKKNPKWSNIGPKIDQKLVQNGPKLVKKKGSKRS